MDTKEKVRGFIISKIASVINGLTDTISRDMNLNNIEHMKLKESLTSITDKHLDNLHKELEVLFKLTETEAATGDRIKMSSGFIGRRLIVDPRELESLSKAITEEASTGRIVNAPWEPPSATDAITKEQIDNPQPKKHKCSSGDRLDIVETRVKELDTVLANLLLLVDSHPKVSLEDRVKELETEVALLKQRSHIHAFPPLEKKGSY